MTQVPNTYRAAGGHESQRSGSNVWLTPPGIVEALGAFDLDPCAAPEPRPWPTAKRHVCPPLDGLTADWRGRVWLNPPYSDIARWLGKLAEHGHGTALVFARTETRWFIDHVWHRADAVLFLHGRLHFCLPDGMAARGNAGAPSALVAYGSEDYARLLACRLPGTLNRGWWVNR
ncbi:adenine methyltransferase [Nocardia sp. BSTN01]|uniref:DNA N-6-adenine-methyltransferase n=1 Tax=Nocardia sp. BSTN01 TaxID=2783665 RepID=UPI00188ECB2D|nr:DNA N-6-adenine-methyltransferase [Nocardia sp. BSTN01]MBF5002364.1 adenine methyltransferase [Nocardia sp. BSTN01]